MADHTPRYHLQAGFIDRLNKLNSQLGPVAFSKVTGLNMGHASQLLMHRMKTMRKSDWHRLNNILTEHFGDGHFNPETAPSKPNKRGKHA